MDLRPVVWDATLVTPRDDRGVTIVVRARYRSLEEICGDVVAVTRSTVGPRARIGRPVRIDHSWAEADATMPVLLVEIPE